MIFKQTSYGKDVEDVCHYLMISKQGLCSEDEKRYAE